MAGGLFIRRLPSRYADLQPYLGRMAFADAIAAGDIVAGSIIAGHIAAGTITAAQIAAGTITAAQIAAGTITAAQIAAGTITASLIQANALAVGVTLDNAISTAITPYGAWVDIAAGVAVTIGSASDFVVFAETVTANVTNLQTGGDEIDHRIIRTDTAAVLVQTLNVATAQVNLNSTFSGGSVPLIYLLSGFPVGTLTLKPQMRLLNGSASGTLAATVTDVKLWAMLVKKTGP